VNEPVLVHSDIHERAKGGDIRDDAGQFHAGLHVFHLLDAFGEAEGFELLARIAAGLGEFGENVL